MGIIESVIWIGIGIAVFYFGVIRSIVELFSDEDTLDSTGEIKR